MKKLCLFLFLLCNSHIQAQEAQILPEGSVLEADFTQLRHLNGIPKPIKSEGHLVLWNGRGLVWTTLTPFPNVILITKKGLYQIQNKQKTAMVKAGGNNAMFDVMAGIFKLQHEGTVTGFAVERLPLVDNHWMIRLLPQYGQVQNFIQSIMVQGDEQITHITISRPNGDHDEIDLKNHAVKEGASLAMREMFDE